jgi:hypothetical protein
MFIPPELMPSFSVIVIKTIVIVFSEPEIVTN